MSSSFVRPGLRADATSLPLRDAARFVGADAPDPNAAMILADGLRTAYLASLLQRPAVDAIPVPEAIAAYRTRDLLRSRAGRVSRGKAGRDDAPLDAQHLAVARNVVEAQLAARGDGGGGGGDNFLTHGIRGVAALPVNVARVAAAEAARGEMVIGTSMSAWQRARVLENARADARTADRLGAQRTYPVGVGAYAAAQNVRANLVFQPLKRHADAPASAREVSGGGGGGASAHDDVVLDRPVMPPPFKHLQTAVVITEAPAPAVDGGLAKKRRSFGEPLLAWWDSQAAAAANGGVGAAPKAYRSVRLLGDTESPASRVIAAASDVVRKMAADAVSSAKAVTSAAQRFNVAQAPEVEPSPPPTGRGLDVPKWPPPVVPPESVIALALRPSSAIPMSHPLPRDDDKPRPSTAAAAPPPKGAKGEAAPPEQGVRSINYCGGLYGEGRAARAKKLAALRARATAEEIKRIALEKKAAKAAGGGAKK
jgi:hypothetical protein